MEKLAKIQRELKAPKNQLNKFGGYKYRNCEDILEAVKPLLDGAILSISDEIVLIGDRYYVKATATYEDSEYSKSVTAYARESEDKKGMDVSQLTGATSSYARKYALNGLFCIDDTKDADSQDNTQAGSGKITDAQIQKLMDLGVDISALCMFYRIQDVHEMTSAQAAQAITAKQKQQGGK